MFTRRRLMKHMLLGAGLAGLTAQTAFAAQTRPTQTRPAQTRPTKASDIDFAEWSEDEPGYRFFPGDKLEVQVRGAPELTRSVQIGPDGRISLALIGPVMAAYQTVDGLQTLIAGKYAAVLIRPEVIILPQETAPLRVLVGGEVKNPGWVEMGPELDGLSAVMAAGGFTHAAKAGKVILLRRSPDGRAMRRIIDLKSPLSGRGDQLYALRRNDLVFVPRTNVAEAGVFVEQYVNNLIPGAILNYFSYRTFN